MPQRGRRQTIHGMADLPHSTVAEDQIPHGTCEHLTRVSVLHFDQHPAVVGKIGPPRRKGLGTPPSASLARRLEIRRKRENLHPPRVVAEND